MCAVRLGARGSWLGARGVRLGRGVHGETASALRGALVLGVAPGGEGEDAHVGAVGPTWGRERAKKPCRSCEFRWRDT